jgi:antitoxin (DNA-binding transcriptional repressor) of toxin-antitoxin stability system
MRVGLREANQQFSALIRAVKAGREVVLTERGQPVAVLKRLVRGTDGEATLRRLEGIGLVRLPARRGPVRPWKAVPIRGASLSATLKEEREDG